MSENLQPMDLEFGHESEDLFRAAKKALTPSTADRDRVRARLALKIGMGAAALSIATTSSKAAAGTAAGTTGAAAAGASGIAVKGASAIPLVAKILVPIALAGAVSTAVVAPRVVAHDDARRHATPTTTMTSSVAPPKAPNAISTNANTNAKTIPTTPADDAPPASVSINDLPTIPSPSAHRSVAHGKATHDVAPNANEVAAATAARDEEAALVSEIDAALRSGDTARASRLVDEHQRRFPSGLLVQEREGARVLVRCTSTPNAALAADFLKAHPRSPMRARILAVCGTSSSNTSE